MLKTINIVECMEKILALLLAVSVANCREKILALSVANCREKVIAIFSFANCREKVLTKDGPS